MGYNTGPCIQTLSLLKRKLKHVKTVPNSILRTVIGMWERASACLTVRKQDTSKAVWTNVVYDDLTHCTLIGSKINWLKKKNLLALYIVMGKKTDLYYLIYVSRNNC